jgi:hypothetical protein
MNVPVMYAELLNVTHASWIMDAFTDPGTKPPFVVVVTAWMRVQLMGDMALRSMFYGPTCTLCTDTADWTIQQKMLNCGRPRERALPGLGWVPDNRA